MDCAISPVLFIMVIEVIIRGCGGNENQLKAFIDNLTVLETEGGKAKELLDRVVVLLKWSGMVFKARKS